MQFTNQCCQFKDSLNGFLTMKWRLDDSFIVVERDVFTIDLQPPSFP